MVKKFSLTLFLCLLVFSSCENETASPDTNTMLFGSFSGHCFGNCFTAFELDSTSVKSDDNEGHFTFDRYEFQSSRTLNMNAFSDAKSIFNSFPDEFNNTDKERFGCPDCADQGGFFIIFQIDGQRKMVLLDTKDTDDQSTEILAFKERLYDFIQEYKN